MKFFVHLANEITNGSLFYWYDIKFNHSMFMNSINLVLILKTSINLDFNFTQYVNLVLFLKN